MAHNTLALHGKEFYEIFVRLKGGYYFVACHTLGKYPIVSYMFAQIAEIVGAFE